MQSPRLHRMWKWNTYNMDIPQKGPGNTVIEFWTKDTCMQTLINQTKSSSKKIGASRNKDSLQYSTQNNWDVPKSSLLNISQCFFSWCFPMNLAPGNIWELPTNQPASVGDPSGSAPKRSQRKFEPKPADDEFSSSTTIRMVRFSYQEIGGWKKVMP